MFFNNFNFLQLCGCAFLGVGVWLHLSYEGYATLYPSHSGLSADKICIFLGSMAMIISFFGCLGSWCESRCCLIIVNYKCKIKKANFNNSLSLPVFFTHHSLIPESVHCGSFGLRFQRRHQSNFSHGTERRNCKALQCNRSRRHDHSISVRALGQSSGGPQLLWSEFL